MSVPLEQMLEELRKAEQARDLMSEVERRLSAGNTDLQNLLSQLEQLGQSLPESDPIRLLIERRGRRGCQDSRFDQSRL